MNSAKGLNAVSPKTTFPSQSDYFPWQRTVKEDGSGSRQSRLSGSLGSGTQSRAFSVGTVQTACSSSCRHSWFNRSPVGLGNINEEEKKKQKLLSVLKMQIKMKESSLCDCKKRYEELVKENISLKEEITSAEDYVHGNAKSLLQRYEKFRGAIGTLHKQYSTQLTTCRDDFKETEKKVLKNIKEFQVQADELNERLLTKTNEVQTLLNYKDKEYPGKALQIAKLKRQRERLRVAHKEELEELSKTVEEHKQRNFVREEYLNKNMRNLVNEEVVRCMNANVKEMAMQNMIMNKEIEIHKNEISQLEDDNSRLEAEIRTILGNGKLNPAEQLFPDIFQLKAKCLPLDEVHLDIPVQTWLPI